MKNRLLILFFTFSLLLMLSQVSVNAETETMTKVETYKSSDEKETRQSETQINDNGANYKLVNETYEIINQEDNFKDEVKTLTVNKETKNKKYAPKKNITRNGIKYKLKSVEDNVRTVRKQKGRKVTGYLSFDSKEATMSAPNEKVFSAGGATANCKKKNMVKEKAAGWQSSYIDFTFTSSDKDYYEWNGHEIDGDSNNPLKGYDDEILKSINVDKSDYKIGKTYWKGSAHKKNGIYIRKLRVEVKKKVPHYRVNYEGYSDDETEDIITYKLTYEGTVQIKTGTTYDIKKTAYYEKVPESKKTVREVLISIGVMILEISFVGILFIVFFKKGNEIKQKNIIKKK